MDEVIEKLSTQVEQEVQKLTAEEQPYVYQELANKLVCLASEALLQACPIEEEDWR